MDTSRKRRAAAVLAAVLFERESSEEDAEQGKDEFVVISAWQWYFDESKYERRFFATAREDKEINEKGDAPAWKKVPTYWFLPVVVLAGRSGTPTECHNLTATGVTAQWPKQRSAHPNKGQRVLSQQKESNQYQKLLEIEKEIVCEVVWGDKPPEKIYKLQRTN